MSDCPKCGNVLHNCMCNIPDYPDEAYKPKMNNDQELVEKIADELAFYKGGVLKNSITRGFAKNVISRCRQHDMQMAIDEINKLKHDDKLWCSDEAKAVTLALNWAEKAIRERFSDE